MDDDKQLDFEARYDAFLAGIQETGLIWGLCTSEDNWAVCSSAAYEETDVMPFWSDEASARAQCTGEWAIFKVQSITLEEFFNDWLPGMHEDDVLVGPNWDNNLEGLEVEPADVAQELDGFMEDAPVDEAANEDQV